MPTKKPKTQKLDYEELGRRLESIYLTGYINKREMLKMSFIKGLATGAGGVFGATLLVALIIWILSLFDTVPLIGPLLENVVDTVDTKTN